MPDFVARGFQKDLKIVFISNKTGQLLDPGNPTVEVVHYDGLTEIIDLPETSLNKIKDGHYIYNWIIPATFPLNETGYIYFRGTDEDGNRQPIEETFRVVDNDFFSGGSGGSSGLVVKFTKD